MAPRLAPLPKIYEPPEVTKFKKAVKKLARKRSVTLVGREWKDDHWKARITFSEAFGANAGEVWSEPLEIEDRTEWAGKEFYMDLNIDQFAQEPQLQGFETLWKLLTPGWTFADGLGATIYDEAISNPLSVRRVIKAPASITVRPKFRVVITFEYLP